MKYIKKYFNDEESDEELDEEIEEFVRHLKIETIFQKFIFSFRVKFKPTIISFKSL
jgi:hypothetical protein